MIFTFSLENHFFEIIIIASRLRLVYAISVVPISTMLQLEALTIFYRQSSINISCSASFCLFESLKRNCHRNNSFRYWNRMLWLNTVYSRLESTSIQHMCVQRILFNIQTPIRTMCNRLLNRSNGYNTGILTVATYSYCICVVIVMNLCGRKYVQAVRMESIY